MEVLVEKNVKIPILCQSLAKSVQMLLVMTDKMLFYMMK
jgi:hypothetical protein